MTHACSRFKTRNRAGFTLIELMIATGIFTFVVAGSLSVYVLCQKFWHSTSLNMQTSQTASMALSKMVYGVGEKSGLRAAASISFAQYPSNAATSASLHSHLFPTNYRYWLDANLPPPHHLVNANCSSNLDMVCTYATYNDGGSWRLMFSNEFSGVQHLEYNCPYQTLSFGTNYQNRVLLAAYVSRATIQTNAMGITLSVTVGQKNGNLISSNTASTYVRFRNKP